MAKLSVGNKAVQKQTSAPPQTEASDSVTVADNDNETKMPQERLDNSWKYHAEKIGEISIQTGRVVVGDPISMPEDFDTLYPDEEAVEILDGYGIGIAVSCETGLGDGKYPVFADIMTDEGGRRIMGLHIPFFPAISFGANRKKIAEIENNYLEFLNESLQ